MPSEEVRKWQASFLSAPPIVCAKVLLAQNPLVHGVHGMPQALPRRHGKLPVKNLETKLPRHPYLPCTENSQQLFSTPANSPITRYYVIIIF